MLPLNEIPIIGGLFEAIQTFGERTFAIARHPFKFMRQQDFNEKQEL